MKIKITGIIIMVIFAGTLIFYTCGKSQPQTDNQIYIGVACYDQKDTFIEELVDAFKEQCSSCLLYTSSQHHLLQYRK